MRYLLVEDNAELAAAILKRLMLDGHAVDHAGSVAEAQDWLETASYDLILLDVMLPDGDGRELLRRSRADGGTPVIMLTARSQICDRVSMLDQGADDYITKPFDFSELEARCRAVLRRRGGSPRNEIAIGTAFFDPSSGRLRKGNETTELRNRETRLLEALARHAGQVMSKERLLDSLFSFDADVTENAIEVYVGRLRKRLEGTDARIETVRGLGYRLDLPR
ncbi:response regulator transcription factor [Profundibacterium mesophilum]|uniref:Two-component system regulatory protein n=1 Tax=Profundibacterium mesophilum KAUST100406-0324 TaxID=1037889 RepID=A0A921NSI2_9RHOB|nr:response regulator transcription factor [Profundibacterium mesophilum]KAF0677180.1 Two-component system regulatory protein [Profundibacterium mesophilum KAUST100406-0324]